jgi:hypothetical protein
MRTKYAVSRWTRRGFRFARAVVLALVTPLLEKNPSKTATFSLCYVPMVLSMSRVIVLLFALAMLHQLRAAGVAGWPEATLCIAIVLALPLLSALEKVSAEDTIAVAKALFTKLGQGATRQVLSVYAGEPNKYDDHREDGGQGRLDEAA